MAFGGAGAALSRLAISRAQKNRVNAAAADYQPFTDANAYRAALERAAYSDAGAQYGQGLGQISGYLARSGPLADSGAATALRTRLASQIYGAAAGRIGGGYADYLANALNQRRQYQYQRQLMAYQRKLGKRSLGSTLGGIAGGIGGALLGGPPGAAAGYGAGSTLAMSDNYGVA